MNFKLVLPHSAADEHEEVRVLEWHFQEGETVPAGGLLVELETAKTLLELSLEAPAVLRRILVGAGEWLTVSTPVAVLSDSADEALPDVDPSTLPDFPSSVDEE